MNDTTDEQPSKRLKPTMIDDMYSFGANQAGQLVTVATIFANLLC
jgi:hypothetical protein